jgi:hypothetical protein
MERLKDGCVCPGCIYFCADCGVSDIVSYHPGKSSCTTKDAACKGQPGKQTVGELAEFGHRKRRRRCFAASVRAIATGKPEDTPGQTWNAAMFLLVRHGLAASESTRWVKRHIAAIAGIWHLYQRQQTGILANSPYRPRRDIHAVQKSNSRAAASYGIAVTDEPRAVGQ